MIELFSNFFLVHKNDISNTTLDTNEPYIYRLKSSNIPSTDVAEIVNKWINLKTVMIEYSSNKNIQLFLHVLFSHILLKKNLNSTNNNEELKDLLCMNQCLFFD
jgi:hypothetical protein